jgi:hypothetical protein
MPKKPCENKTKRSEEPFASNMEKRYYDQVIKPGLKNGSIKSVRRQVPYELQPAFYHNGRKYESIRYVSDFNIIFPDGTEQVIDVKGLARSIDIVKRKLLLHKYTDINFVWLTYSPMDGGWVSYETVKQRRGRERQKRKKGETKE